MKRAFIVVSRVLFLRSHIKMTVWKITTRVYLYKRICTSSIYRYYNGVKFSKQLLYDRILLLFNFRVWCSKHIYIYYYCVCNLFYAGTRVLGT